MTDFDNEMRMRLMQRWEQFSSDICAIMRSDVVPLADADLPDEPGIYIFVDEHMSACYVGMAERSLRDRVLNKHISGDESHALQHAYMDQFPDRIERRRYIKSKIGVKWRIVPDTARLADIERLLIWLLQPRYNRR